MNAHASLTGAVQGSAGPGVVSTPITSSDAEISEALEHANIPALLASLVHLTGDAGILTGRIRPTPQTLGDDQGGVSPEDQVIVRRMALEAIAAYRDNGCRPPAPMGESTILDIMSFMAAEPIPQAYVPLLMEEMRLEGDDRRRLVWSTPERPGAAANFRVAIIGAGLSGVLSAIRLQQAGIAYDVFEKNIDVGGTWFENTYPGCRVDNPSHFYSYSFEQNLSWQNLFSRQSDLLEYIRTCAVDYNVYDSIRFSTEVVAARWSDTARLWTLRVKGPDGAEYEVTANAIISAMGQLNRPRFPDIEGVDTFQGPRLHTAKWDSRVSLAGKRVAVVGTGASAFQLVPEIVDQVSHLTVFQRTPPWIYPTPAYHDDVPAGHKWLLQHLPYYANWYRFWLFWTLSDGLLPMVTADPAWTDRRRAVNAANDASREMLTASIKDQLEARPDLVAKCVPDYPVLGKRLLRDNGLWYRALQKSNVDLVDTPIRRITPTGLELNDGRTVEVDVLIFATGFEASRFFSPVAITGRGGRSLESYWGDEPRAYLGVTIPGLPNFFCLYGPNVNIVHGGSMIFMSECGVRYITESLKLLIEEGHAAMEPRQDVHDDYNRRIDEANANRTWGVPTVKSWYKNASGRVSQCWPLRFADYWEYTHSPDPEDYVFD